MAVFALVCIAVLLYVCWLYLKPRKAWKFPAGPKGKPFFGSALDLTNDNFSQCLYKLGEPYKEAFTLKIFGEKLVFLQSHDIIREAIVSSRYAQTFSGRPPNFYAEYMATNGFALTTYSKEWVALRRMMFQGLKMYGSHLVEVEELVQIELGHMINRLQGQTNKSVDLFPVTSAYFTCVMLMLLTGSHVNHDDPLVTSCNDITSCTEYIVGPGVSQILTMFPWLRHLPFGYGKVVQRAKSTIKQIFNTVDDMRKNNSKKNACFMDYMEGEIEKGTITQELMHSSFWDLLSAGIATSRANSYNMILVLTKRPDIQSRIQEEIDEVIGRSRLPCAEDKQRMPYTQAFMMEALRFYTGIYSLPHSTMEDVQIRDYFLPKDTTVFYSMWGVHYDDEFWGNPWTFDPKRFLDEDGNLLPLDHEKRQRMLPFGIGKRSCVGETLARLRIFLALTAILQKFTLNEDPENPLPGMDPRDFKISIILMAERYRLILRYRD